MKIARILISTLAVVLLVAGPARAILAPVPVIDVGIPENKTWLSQLIQQIAMQKDIYQSLQIAIQNITPTNAPWPTTTQDPRSTEPILDAQVATLNTYLATVKAQVGVAPPVDAALQMAEAAMQELPNENADIANAQAASDNADGSLAAEQAGHRINILQVTNGTKIRQFLYAQQLQRSTEEAATMAWMSMPSVTAGQN